MGPIGLLSNYMNEMFDSTPAHLPYDRAKVLTLWPQARGELQGLANAMERGGSPITASQLRLAVALADCFVAGCAGEKKEIDA